MKRMLLLLALLLAPAAVPAQTQTQMKADSCSGYRKSDAELNRVYAEILKPNSGDAAFTKAMRAAQRAWLAFRDAQVQAIYPDPDPAAYGSANATCRCSVLEQLTRERVKQLRDRWITGAPEGDACAGSSARKK